MYFAYFCTYYSLPHNTNKLEHGHIFAFRNIITVEVKGKVKKKKKTKQANNTESHKYKMMIKLWP